MFYLYKSNGKFSFDLNSQLYWPFPKYLNLRKTENKNVERV